MCFKISQLDEVKTDVMSYKELRKEIFSVIALLFKSKRLLLLIPYHICFGLHSGFIGYYVNRKIVATGLGDGYIGAVSALATLTATLLAVPYARVSNIVNKWVVMVFGTFCFTFCGFCLLIFSDHQVMTYQIAVIIFIILPFISISLFTIIINKNYYLFTLVHLSFNN